MQLKNKPILLISPEAWGKSYVSKHHYALELAKKGNEVYFLNPPSSSFRIKQLEFGVNIIDYRPIFRGLGKIPSFISSYLTRIELLNIEKKIGKQFKVIWNFDSSRFFDLKKLRKGVLKIGHIVDLSENLQRHRLSKSMDIGFCTTDFIQKEMLPYNSKVFKVHHGYRPPEKFETLPIIKDEKVKVGYVGNLSIKYLDWDIIYKIAKENSELNFYFIGPVGKSNISNTNKLDPFLLKTQSLKNTFFLGAKPSKEIPAYLELFDILLLAYRVQQYREQLASPHKVMEYLGAGKTILASYTDEYKDKSHLLEMVENNAELPLHFQEVVSQLNDYNSKEKKDIRIAFAMANTYGEQIKRIENLIASL
ncbi:hypothetical protein [Xanthovirga aplysinae]|uniref:hypothetical protein n=1 Tax=Xanthovirga aplysinae TaxID=2529853 RepID=UPI0012BB5075|nr:hypothetical protein [Xanthovirga aplysinae]MTI32485.1 hypothetical protein [Xanthovirga aplysinae]